MTAATARPTDPAVVPWILRIGVAACFIGHGALGLDQTAAWTSYFAVAGINREHALALMPWVGAFDVAMALSVLFCPVRGIIVYMAGWALWTALLRPLAGEPIWEAVERAGNYGAPLALSLFFIRGRGIKDWLSNRLCDTFDPAQLQSIGWVLRVTTVLLLVGHGALGCVSHKAMFTSQYTMIGLPGPAAEGFIGGFECLLALAILIKPDRRLLFGAVIWKLASEALCPMAGAPLWVFVEHGGSYTAPLALAFLQTHPHPVRIASVPERTQLTSRVSS